MYSRQKVVDLACSWVGFNEKNGKYKQIVDIYNSYGSKHKLPRGTKMQYDWPWCACTWSALAIYLDYTDIMPIEISVPKLITLAQVMGIWQENDGYVPSPGDAICYDWQDNGVGDNKGGADHIGVVTYVNTKSGYFVVVEGNYNDAVKKRTVSINGKYIRGFITPKYDQNDSEVVEPTKASSTKSISEIAHEVIAGKWSSGSDRKSKLEAAGYDYSVVQAEVNKILNTPSVKEPVTTCNGDSCSIPEIRSTARATHYDKLIYGSYRTNVDLYLRNDAGTNKKALLHMPKDQVVHCYGYYSIFNGAKWYYVTTTYNNVVYTGFCFGGYLTLKK